MVFSVRGMMTCSLDFVSTVVECHSLSYLHCVYYVHDMLATALNLTDRYCGVLLTSSVDNLDNLVQNQECSLI